VIEELLGTRTRSAIVGLPGRLAYLFANLPPGYPGTVETFIDQHTLLPFYAPFLPTANLQRLYTDMRGTSGKGMQGRASAVTSGFPLPEWFRFCPACVEADREQFGECYWHRVHQVSGIEVCPTHAVWLEQSHALMRYRYRVREFTSAESAIRVMSPRPLDLSNACHQVLLELARDADWLLCQHNLPTDLEVLQKRYMVTLIQQEFATSRGLLLLSKLWREFRAYYPPDLFQLLHADLEERITLHWLSQLVHRTHRRYHPISHLLMIHFLGYSLAEFLCGDVPTEYRPFGEAPWLCLNPVSDHYRQSVIHECSWIHSSSGGRPMGTFACPLCGFVYTRMGPDRSAEDRFRRSPTIKTCGPVWEAEMTRLWSLPNTSLQYIARQLGIECHLLRKHALRLKLPLPRPNNPNNLKPQTWHGFRIAPPPASFPLEDYRARWLTHVKEHPNASRTELFNGNASICGWLRRHDREWLELHLPPCRSHDHRPRQAQWKERDQQFVVEVEKAALFLRNLPGRPVQITRASISRQTGKRAWLYSNLDVLPLTAQVLANLIETDAEFSVRKVEWAAEQYRQENHCPSRTKLIEQARVGGLAQHPQVQMALNAALHMLSQFETGS
jgi:hypothetical protein